MYGKDPETECLLQVLQSDEMRLYMARRYNLYRHYDIDTTSIDKGAKLQKNMSTWLLSSVPSLWLSELR